MKTVEDDKTLIQTLSFLRNNNNSVYINIKRSAQAALKMYLFTSAEQAFLNRDIQSYDCYRVHLHDAELFSEYCQLTPSTDTLYLYIRADRLFAAVYCVNDSQIIVQRKGLFSATVIEDILYSFEDSLQPCYPLSADGIDLFDEI